MNPSSPLLMWIGDVVAVAAFLGLGWKFTVRPHLQHWIQQEIVEPLADVRHMTAKNGGKNDPATLPDWMHNIEGRMSSIEAHLRRQDREAERREADEAQRWAEHRAWSDAQLAKKVDK